MKIIKKNTIAFFTDKNQFQKIYNKKINIDHWIAITPYAEYIGEKYNLNYSIIEDYYNDPYLMKKGIQNFNKVSKFCDSLDLFLNISTHNHYPKIKLLFDSFLNKIFILNSFFKKNKICKVIGFDISKDFTDIRDIIKENYLLFKILPFFLDKYNIQYESIGVLEKLDKETNEKTKNSLIQDCDFSKKVLITAESNDFGLNKIIDYWSKEKIGFVINKNDLISYSKKNNEKEFEEFSKYLKEKMKKVWLEIESNKNIKKNFIIENIDCYSFLRGYFHQFIENTIYHDMLKIFLLDKVLSKFKNAIILLSSIDAVLFSISKKYNIPSIVIQHGGGFGYLNFYIYKYLYFKHPSHFLCWGECVKNEKKYNTNFIKIGSPYLDEIVKINKNKINKYKKYRTIVYVITNLGGDRRYFSYHMAPDIWYYNLQKKIVKLCMEFENIKLIIKMYPKQGMRKDLLYNPLCSWIRDNSFNRCKVIFDKPYKDLLNKGDIFIIDCPTTTLLEALTTDKPIIAYADNRWFKFDKSAEMLLKKRAYFTNNEKDFFSIIKKELQDKNWNKKDKKINNDFLKKFGVYLENGKSLERAVEFLREIK